MNVKSIFLAAVVAVLAICFATPAFAAIGNQGRILYTKNVVRNTDGTIARTGNLFVKDLTTGAEQQVTNYTGTFVINNPMFNADGTKIIYTSNVAVGTNTTYKVYIVSADASVNSGIGIELQSGVSTINYKYAALSPDENTIAFVYEDVSAGETSLWTYNRTNRIYQQIYADTTNGIDIKNVVFVNNTTLAFIGKSGNVQNIYLSDLSGPTTTKITANTTSGVEYLSLKSAIKSPSAGNMLIYSKRIKSGPNWLPYDIYVTVSLVPFLEANVTNTSLTTQHEYEACFYGDDAAIRDVQLTSTNGNMFYIARVIGSDNKIWQANFDTIGGSTNTGKTQRTVDADIAGQPDWAPPVTEQAPTLGINNTELVYIANFNTIPEVWKAGFDERGILQTGTPISIYTSSPAKDHPSLGYGRVAFSDTTGNLIARVNSDGTGYTNFHSSLPVNKMPFITPDGKWIVFVSGPNDNSKQLYAKRITESLSDPALSISGLTVTNAENPIVSPDMSSLVWVDKVSGGVSTINKVGIQFNFEANSVSIIGTQQTLAGNTGQCNDKDPRFSPDGTKIIFVSDRDGSNKIYTMDAGTGLGVTLFPLQTTPTEPAYPVYSPLNDGSIAFVAGLPGARTIQMATATGVVTDTGRTVNKDKIDWKIIRKAGEITAERILQPRAPAGITIDYSIKIDIDDAKTPISYTLEEVIPSWTVTSVTIDGNPLGAGTDYYVLNNTPVAGLTTLKFVFSNTGGSAGPVADHILTISVTTAGTGTKSFSGTISYFMNNVAQSSLVTGNGILDILKPYCPIDIYNSKKEINQPDGVIQDLDLLYGIQAWSTGAKLPGYGTGWPANPSANWDNIILAAINIWATPAGTRGYYWSSVASAPAQVNLSDASTKAGEYLYLGLYDGDTTPDVYATSGALAGTAEMYWTQGKWSD